MNKIIEKSRAITIVAAVIPFALYLASTGPARVHMLKQESKGKWSAADQSAFDIIYYPVLQLARTSDLAAPLFHGYTRLCGGYDTDNLYAQHLLDRAELYQVEGKVHQAFRIYDELRRESPYYGHATSSSAVLDYHIEACNYETADILLQDLHDEYLDGPYPWPIWYLQWASVAIATGDYQKARNKCSDLIYNYPGSSSIPKARKMLMNIEARRDSTQTGPAQQAPAGDVLKAAPEE